MKQLRYRIPNVYTFYPYTLYSRYTRDRADGKRGSAFEKERMIQTRSFHLVSPLPYIFDCFHDDRFVSLPYLTP